MKKSDRVKFEMELLEKVADKAWGEEAKIAKIIFKGNKKLIKEISNQNGSWCQGITNNLDRRIGSIFECQKMCFDVKGKKHVALLVKGTEQYVVDGAIRQFLPKQRKRVFTLKEYPLDIENPTSW